MRRAGIYALILLVAAILLSSSVLACSKGTDSTTGTTAGGSQTSIAASAVATRTGVPKPGGMPDIVDMKSLPSYRLTITNKLVEGAGGGSSVIKYEWVRDQKAEHTRMEDGNGKVTMEMITIGDKQWIWMGMAGMGWIEQPPQTAPPPSAMSSDLAGQIKQAQQDIEHSQARFDKKGTETVNNVRCTRYEFEYNLATQMPNLPTGGATKTDMHSSGEVWIADQTGLPAVMIKSTSTVEIAAAGKKTVMGAEQNLTDIGAAITIKPPEGSMQVPTGIPGVPTGIATIPPNTAFAPPTAGTSPPATVTPSFNDDFQAAWNSRWVWTDPNDDATYSFTEHAGFLRITVPDGNDLAGVTNYDAPRLLVPQKGNFMLEALVEFDPREIYQGAGLVVWQDENSFLRVEFGFGGMGGDAKNVVFVTGDGGFLVLVNGIDLPDAMKRIELRLQRNGDRFTAWYRQVGGTWQEIGSTEIVLDSTVDVGITQVTQYTMSEISADFDYFRLFIK